MATDANAELRKEPIGYSVRRFVLFIVELCILYFFVWVPLRPNRAGFLLFFGSGMIQVAAIYALDWNPIDTPTLFMNGLMRVFVALLAVAVFVSELVFGFGSKPWWEAMLLPIPPFIIASVWYKNRNPAAPFFTGLIALLVALLLRIIA